MHRYNTLPTCLTQSRGHGDPHRVVRHGFSAGSSWSDFGWRWRGTGFFDFPASPEISPCCRWSQRLRLWWLIWPWIERGTLSPRLCGLGVAGAARGSAWPSAELRYGGVNETLWLLLAAGLNATDKRCWRLPWFVQPLLLLLAGISVVVAASIGGYRTCYRLRKLARLGAQRRDRWRRARSGRATAIGR